MNPTTTRRAALAAALLLGLAPAAPVRADDQDPALVAIDSFIASQTIDRSSPAWKTHLAKPPKLRFTKGRTYSWLLETNLGPIKVNFLPDVAPMHVSSAIYLTRLGFYDGTRFHRVIPGFMAQGGDPLGNGRGGPGYHLASELSPSVTHDRAGQLAAANRGPGTDGSQFFLTFAATPWLDGDYTIYGQVVAGKAVLKKLEARGTEAGPPSEPLTLERATVTVE